MARFEVGRPITTTVPLIEVDAGLRPGAHRFQLQVVTADGRASRPDTATVSVVDSVTDPTVRDRIVIDRPITPLDPVVRDVDRPVLRDVNGE